LGVPLLLPFRLPVLYGGGTVPAVTVLIVDDDSDHHAVCGLLLAHAGYRVLHAGDGAEALRICRAELPDVVLMDVRMAGMDGILARRGLADDPRTAAIPVAAVTADVLMWPEARALAEGFAAHVSKPCTLARILTVVRALTGGAEAEMGGIAVPRPLPALVA
jgi:two-component system cell cycle response regulator DivK